MEGIQVITQDFVNVHITTSNSEDAAAVERRFKKGITVLEFKTKLELVTGGSAATMTLQLFDINNKYICDINIDDALLGSYPIDDGMRIHVVDNFNLVKDFAGSDSTERFRLSEEEYQKKGDTLRSFLQKNKLGKYNKEELSKFSQQQEADYKAEQMLAETILVGSRCEVKVPGQPTRRGIVRYNGSLDNVRGHWIGIEYDEPVGRHDGTVTGKKYFQCQDKYGSFVRPAHVTTGDFPVEGLEDDEI